ncbi:hypothetical protein MNBD_GAMMA11-807 [hydrothermal vent metagenome]|uniref:Type II secretion system protein GspI C-terminal domain-containing protein n=1 Tax=hydrothermal vent metagenome TaxID=652676 RepID=A0A3B0Y285_9ZZZZ
MSSTVTKHPTIKRTQGFTLIEVMVALAIIAIALSSLIKASGSHTSTAAYLKSKTLAHYVAMNEIADLQTKRSWPDLGSTEDSTEMADFEWYWTRKVDPVGEASAGIRSMQFTVYMDENRTRSLAQIQAFISNPANNQPAIVNNGNTGNQNNNQTNNQGGNQTRTTP